MTISTCSSAATLPYTLKVCKEELKVDEKTVGIVAPLGTTIHMCGGAVSFSLLGIFCAQLFGVDITNLQFFYPQWDNSVRLQNLAKVIWEDPIIVHLFHPLFYLSRE